MDNPLANALMSDEYAESTGLENEVERTSRRDNHRPDYETEPDAVTLGEDGNYYANDNRWTPGVGWTTIVMDEPVYYVEGGNERSKVDDDQWEYDEFGNVVTKDADFAANGKALNPSGKWMSEQEIRNLWESGTGMKNFKRANPNMSADDYMGFVKETTALKAQGIERIGEGGISPEYQSVYDQYGIETSYTGKDGRVYEFNGSGYTLTVDGVDRNSMILHGAALGILGAGISAGIAPVVSSVLGSAGSKAASSAIVNLAKQYMTTGELNFEDALMSAALSYGGSQLSDALNASGVVSDLASKFDQVTGDLVGNGGDILKSALTAGGMSLVTQMVKDGEIDWKDAALAAAMAGGTTALQGFLADIGKADAEGEVLEEIKVTAQRKGEQVGDGLWKLDDGTVVSDTGNVLGNISNLDTDGDGLLNANDLQGIDVTHDYVDENYTPYQDAYAGKKDVYVDANGRPVDPVGIKYSLDKDGYVDGNGNLVTKVSYGDAYGGNTDLGPVDNQGGLVWESHGGTDGVITFEDGRFYAEKVDGQWIGADGQVIDDPRVVDELTLVAAKAIDEPLTSVEYFDQSGNPVNYKYAPYGLRDNYEQGQFSGLIFGPNGERQEVWYDPVTNTEYIKAQGTTEIIAIRNPETPPEPVDPQDPDQTYKNQDTTDSSKDGGGGGDIGSAGDPSTNGTAGPDGSTNPTPTPTPNPTSYPELVQIAQIAGITVQEVISRLNDGETVDQITGKGDTPVTPPKGDTPDTPVTPPKKPENNNDHTLGGGATGGNTDSGGDTIGDKTGNETGGDTSGGGDNTEGNGNGGNDGVSDTGGNDSGDDTGGTVTHVLGAGSAPGGSGQGSGAGSGTGTGGGSGNGEGQGDGDGSGNGNGNGNGNGFGGGLGGGGGGGRPEWGPLFPTAPYRPFQRHAPKVTRSLFGDLMGLGK